MPNRRTIVLAAALAGLAPPRPARPATADPAPPFLPPGAQSRFAQVNGIRLHYVRAGTGPALLLLHGWPQTWCAFAETMRALSDRFTVIAPDLRGLGRSERTPSGYDKRTIAADLRALIALEAGGRAHVVGHDMGGKAAYMLAHLHPDSVDRLVLMDCLLPGTENMDAASGGAWHYGFHMAPGIPEMLTAGRERDYIRAQIRAWSHRKAAVSEASITEHARHYASPGGMEAGFAYYRALPEDAALAAQLRKRRLTLPILAIAGRQGVGLRLSEALRAEADRVESVIVEECGHFVAEEAPGPFREALSRFLTA